MALVVGPADLAPWVSVSDRARLPDVAALPDVVVWPVGSEEEVAALAVLVGEFREGSVGGFGAVR